MGEINLILTSFSVCVDRKNIVAIGKSRAASAQSFLILTSFSVCVDRKNIVAIGKSRAASAQSFTLAQQATIEIKCHDHSIIACSRHLHMVLFFAHIPFVVNRAFNATPAERLQQYDFKCKWQRRDFAKSSRRDTSRQSAQL